MSVDLHNLDAESIALLYLAEELSPEERAHVDGMLQRGDTALRERVEMLLFSHEYAGAFLDEPALVQIASSQIKLQLVSIFSFIGSGQTFTRCYNAKHVPVAARKDFQRKGQYCFN